LPVDSPAASLLTAPVNGPGMIKNLWNDADAAHHKSDVEMRVYTSRLLGKDSTLVLHGGGNTSVKVRERSAVGEEEEILYVKGSGWDLETIEAPGFAPVRMAHLVKLARLESLSDPQMMNELATQVTRSGAPAPSVEAILHAILPHKFVDHTHSDALLAITNTPGGDKRAREIYGKDTVIVPYVMPGFDLARQCARQFAAEAHSGTIGMVLLNHGIFSFGATARESYERMIELVSRAEKYLAGHRAWDLPTSAANGAGSTLRHELARLRKEISASAGFPVVLVTHSGPRFLEFARRSDIERISQQGPATPDHVLRTKRLPMLGRNVEAYAAAYREYFKRNTSSAKESKTMLDAAPRVIVDPEFGLGCVGRTAKDARIVHDLYSHTIEVILRATALGGYQALPEHDIFDVEYWDLEQAKLKKAGAPAVFAGEVALVTGAASGIGKACVESLLKRGAAVIGLDVNDGITQMLGGRADFLGVQCDVTSEAEATKALETGVRAFGGLDIMVLNAGVFPGGRRIDALDSAEWRRVLQVNLDANFTLMRECHPLLKLAPRGGRVVIVGSKNVPAPGPGAAAYSASKAALTQLARVAALEWGADGIRVNTLHPNAVFDTAAWTEDVLATRAQHYGVSVEEYKKKNVLNVEIRSQDVAELAAEVCGPLFSKTTGAQVPVDGGNDRVI
jgi:rhamnose utilization protein RhaD (predicted bifunctional aldolase and dehydrogenase)/NAD(P)-dependent dehydrogenase (short-subunit alcohol dehydrogenase family)